MDVSGIIVLVAALIAGLAVGIAIGWALRAKQVRQSEEEKRRESERIIEQVRASFGELSLSALTQQTQQFLQLAKSTLSEERAVTSQELEGKKSLIDRQLESMSAELEKVQRLMSDLEKDRAQKFGELDNSLKAQQQHVQDLLKTTQSLREALSSTKARGQWGERMAEDVLRLVGFIEGVNYYKQQTLSGSGTRPDFTFRLPQGLVLNMDVKFPLDNYLRFLDASADAERARYRADFLRDVRNHVKAVTTRDYIDPNQNTIDYVLLFIPNEQVYSFINEQDTSLLDEALKSKVIICSPLTLYAILAVIRQSLDNFALEKSSRQILGALSGFRKQWGEFIKSFDKLGDRITAAQQEYERLYTTRRKQLDRTIEKIEDLRSEKGLLLEEATGVDASVEEDSD